MSTLGVIPTYLTHPNDVGVLKDALASIKATEPELEIVVVDDGSPLTELVDEAELVITGLEYELARQPTNEGFSRTVNVGLRRALEREQNAVLINADIEFIEEGWLAKMECQPRRDGEGLADVVGALLLYPSGLIQHAGIFFSLLHRCFEHRFKYAPGDLPEAQVAERCPVTGALQFIRHPMLQTIGLYDERFRLGWEDVDFCIRTFQEGGDCVYQPKIRAFHFESMFRGRPSKKIEDWQARSWIYFSQKHAGTSFAEWVPSLI